MKTKNLSLDLEKWRETWWSKRERKACWNNVLELVQSKKPRAQVERAASDGSGNSSSTVTGREGKIYRSRFRWVSSCDVTKSGIQLLATLKLIKESRVVKRKGCLFQRPPTRGLGRLLSTNQFPHHWQSVGKSFYRQREGATGRNSTVSSHSGISYAIVWSESSWLF